MRSAVYACETETFQYFRPCANNLLPLTLLSAVPLLACVVLPSPCFSLVTCVLLRCLCICSTVFCLYSSLPLSPCLLSPSLSLSMDSSSKRSHRADKVRSGVPRHAPGRHVCSVCPLSPAVVYASLLLHVNARVLCVSANVDTLLGLQTVEAKAQQSFFCLLAMREISPRTWALAI